MSKIDQRKDDRIVVGNNDIAGLANWFYGNHGVKLTSGGKFHCNGNVVYSYETPIGKLYENVDGEVLMLITTVRYSTTTFKHINALAYECDLPMARVPNVSPNDQNDHILNATHLLESAITAGQTYTKAKLETFRKVSYKEVRTIGKSLVWYIDFFGVESDRLDFYQLAHHMINETDGFINLIDDDLIQEVTGGK